jgi:hypothetical protein
MGWPVSLESLREKVLGKRFYIEGEAKIDNEFGPRGCDKELMTYGAVLVVGQDFPKGELKSARVRDMGHQGLERIEACALYCLKNMGTIGLCKKADTYAVSIFLEIDSALQGVA